MERHRRVILLLLCAMAIVATALPAHAADEKYFARLLTFPDGAKAMAVLPESWQAESSGDAAVGAGSIRLILQSQDATMLTACQWSAFTAKMVDFPSDNSLDVDLHQRSREWFAPRGAEDACLSFIVSGASEAVSVRVVFVAHGTIYCMTTGRMKWGTDIDAAAFTALERDMNILGNYFYFEKTDGYAKLEKALAEGGLMLPAGTLAGTPAVAAPHPVDPAPTGISAGADAQPAGGVPAISVGSAQPSASGSQTMPGDAPATPSRKSDIPRDADLERADRLKLSGKFAEAEEIYRALIAKSPYESNNGIGDICVQTGRYDEAETHFREAAAMKPDAPDAWNGLGSVFFYRAEWGDASEYFNRALSVDPTNVVALSNLGWVALAQGNTAEAGGYFNRALQSGPVETESVTGLYTGLAQVALASGEPDKAAEYAEKIIKIIPDSAAAFAMKAQAQLAKGEAVPALESAARAVAIEPTRHEYHAIEATAAMAAKDYARAVAAWQNAIQNAPTNPPAVAAYYEGIAHAQLAAGDKASALETATRASGIFPGDKILEALKIELEK